jgi:uncharacterized protein DUF6152
MIRRALVGLAIAAVLLSVKSAYAHHNMSALFDFNDRVTLTGTLSKVDWRNPHIYLTVDVKKVKGASETWLSEGPAPNWFRIRDIAKADFQSSMGQSLTIEVSRARDHSKSGLIRTIKLPNGRVVSACPQNC